ncbi:MAG: carboxypeptidase regulatory-like domain-containing protein [Candidatus Cloacimonetes bacterium]|nr:carboxypeptidase regulatory-like domain-containing protein [Candidatus Cloacimonadota bacterium]
MVINIWIGETSLISLSDGWIPANELCLVYSGIFDFPIGRNENFIVLDEPYLYEGENLVIMTEHYYSIPCGYEDPLFLYTEYPELPVRCLKCHDNHANEIDPYNPPDDHYQWNLAPNTRLWFNCEDLGSINGYAFSAANNMPLENILIQISDTNNHTYTDEYGYYEFPELVAGSYSLEASKLGYFPEVIDLEVITDETTQQNFYLQPIDQIAVSGHITGSDQPEISLPGAEVSLRGLGIHTCYTDENGNFNIPTVYVNTTYQLYVILQGYEILMDEIIVTTEDIDLGELMLIEISYPVSNVTAWQNDEDTIMNLSWSSPSTDGSKFWDFEEDDGGFEVTLTWEWGIDEMVGSHSGEKVWGTALNENYPGYSYGEIVSPEVRIFSDDAILSFWHWYHMEENYDGGNVKISTDNGTTWSIITPLGGYPENAIQNNNTMSDEPAYNGNCTDWIPATFELGEFLGETVRLKFQFGVDSNINFEGWFIDDVYIGSAANNQRLIESYNIFRLLFDDQQNQANWETIAIGWTDTTYSDPSWERVDSDIYKYAIEATYSGNMISEPVLSNYVARGYYTTACVTVYDMNQNPVPDAWVQFTCEDDGPENDPIVYEQYTYENGEVYIPLLWRGYYDILIIPENMEPYQDGTFLIDTPYTLTVNLAEILNPVAALDYSVISNDVTLRWSTPSNQHFYDFEVNNGDFTGDDEWEWANGCNQGEAFSGENCWSLCPNEEYPTNADISLYTPGFLIPTEDTQLSFYLYYYIEMCDGGNLKISTNNGISWEIIYPTDEYPARVSVWNAAMPGEPCWNGYSNGWVQCVFELGEYRGEEVLFRFQFSSDDGPCYDGFYIDDFRIGQPSPGVRVPEYYNVYRDSVLIATNLLESEFLDAEMVDGTYTYGVSTVYSAGESEVSEVEVMVYPIDISGFITLSDLAGNPPAEEVTVTLENDIFFWEINTNENGEFCFENINGNQTYTIRAEYDNYYAWSEELQVNDENINFDMITLNRVIYPTFDVAATVNEADTECYLNWNEPETWNEYEISFDDDESEISTCWNDATNERAVWFTTQGGPCMVTGGSINIDDGLWPSGNVLAPFTAAVWEFNSNSGLPGAMLGSVEVIPENYFWVDFTFDNPILIEGTEFFLGYIQDTNYPDCPPIAVDESYPTVNRSFRHWLTGGEPWMLNPYYQDFMIRAIVAGPEGNEIRLDYNKPTVDISGSFPAGSACSQPPNHVTGIMQTGAASYQQITGYQRDLVGYNIIRGEYEEQNNWYIWNPLNTEPVTDLSFIDTDWVNMELETNYSYGVIAVYGNNNLTVPAFSNWIARDAFATLQLSLTTNTGDIPAGAIVTLTASAPDPDGIYPVHNAITDENGECTILWIRKGNYELEAELEGFALLFEQINILEDEVFYDGMITEILYPPYQLNALENHTGTIDLSWHAPADFENLYYDFDGSETEFIGDPGWVWGNTSNSGEPPSGYNCWSTFPGENYDFWCNIALFSPPLTVQSADTQLIFQHWYDIRYSAGANVKVSTDGGLSWQVIEPFGGYPQEEAYHGNPAVGGQPSFDGNSGGWITSAFCLADYYEQEIIIKFHFGSTGSEPHLGWDIDNVFVGIPDNQTVRRDRMECYHLSRGLADEQANYDEWELLASGLQDTTYLDSTWLQVTEPGEYQYCVRAEYTGNVLSNPSFSNTVSLITHVPVTINVSCNSGDPADSAQVILAGHDGVHNYNAIVADGFVHWDEVRKGVYYISILKNGFEPWQDLEYWITDLTVMNIELIEIPYPPANVAIDYVSELLTWDIPVMGLSLSTQNALSKASSTDRYVSYYNIYLADDIVGQTVELQYPLADLNIAENQILGVSVWYSSNVESEIIEVIYNSANGIVEIPRITCLNHNYPNPFNPSTCLSFVLAEPGYVTLDICNLKGQKIITLLNKSLPTGKYKIHWDGTDSRNRQVASGIYLYRLHTPDYHATRKMILLR